MALSLKEIEEKLKACGTAQSEYEAVAASFRNDPRAGVANLLKKYDKKFADLIAERERLEKMMTFEREQPAGSVICGIDEAGRGPLAGPVVAAAVILPEDYSEFLYVNDSKQLSEKKREALYEVITKRAVSYGVGIVEPDVIDEINILQADYEAMRIAVSRLTPKPEILLNDAVVIPDMDKILGYEPKQVKIIKGDAKSLSIAAASIVAKVTMDRIMREYDQKYPQYGFAGHKGYGSASHIAAIKAYGPCQIHRRTFIGNFIK